MESLGKSVLGFFNLDIGTGESTFELVVGDLGSLMRVLQILAMVFVFFFFLTAIIRSMTSADGRGGNPTGIVITTFVAGVMVYEGPVLVNTTMKLFNVFYQKCVQVLAGTETSFSTMGTAIVDAVENSPSTLAASEPYTAAVASTILSFFLILLVSIQFIKYIIEMVQRYVVLGTLVFTSPLAFSLIASPSTRPSFFSWIKMLLSQFLLMLFNVVFLSAFYGVSETFLNGSYSSVSAFRSTGNLTKVALICLLMYAILFVGCKVDSYLKTVGLSTAETGSALAANVQLVALEMLSAPGALFGSSSHDRGGHEDIDDQTNLRAMTPDERMSMLLYHPVKFAKTVQKEKQNEVSAKHAVSYNKDGYATARSINNAVINLKHGDAISGVAIGQTIKNDVRGLPKNLVYELDAASAVLKRDGITMRGTGQYQTPYSVDFIPISNFVTNGQIAVPKYGRMVSIGGEDYIAVATGAGARHFNTYNPAAVYELQDCIGIGSVYEPLNEVSELRTLSATGEGVGSGVYSATLINKATGQTVQRQWAPTSCMEPRDGEQLPIVHAGSLDYWQIDTPLSQDDRANVNPAFDYPPITADPDVNFDGFVKQMQHQDNLFANQFPEMSANGVRVVKLTDDDSMVVYRDGSLYAMKSAVENYAKPNGVDRAGIVRDCNGSPYVMTEIKWDGDPFESEVDAAYALAKEHDEASMHLTEELKSRFAERQNKAFLRDDLFTETSVEDVFSNQNARTVYHRESKSTIFNGAQETSARRTNANSNNRSRNEVKF